MSNPFDPQRFAKANFSPVDWLNGHLEQVLPSPAASSFPGGEAAAGAAALPQPVTATAGSYNAVDAQLSASIVRLQVLWNEANEGAEQNMSRVLQALPRAKRDLQSVRKQIGAFQALLKSGGADGEDGGNSDASALASELESLDRAKVRLEVVRGLLSKVAQWEALLRQSDAVLHEGGQLTARKQRRRRGSSSNSRASLLDTGDDDGHDDDEENEEERRHREQAAAAERELAEAISEEEAAPSAGGFSPRLLSKLAAASAVDSQRPIAHIIHMSRCCDEINTLPDHEIRALIVRNKLRQTLISGRFLPWVLRSLFSHGGPALTNEAQLWRRLVPVFSCFADAHAACLVADAVASPLIRGLHAALAHTQSDANTPQLHAGALAGQPQQVGPLLGISVGAATAWHNSALLRPAYDASVQLIGLSASNSKADACSSIVEHYYQAVSRVAASLVHPLFNAALAAANVAASASSAPVGDSNHATAIARALAFVGRVLSRLVAATLDGRFLVNGPGAAALGARKATSNPLLLHAAAVAAISPVRGRGDASSALPSSSSSSTFAESLARGIANHGSDAPSVHASSLPAALSALALSKSTTADENSAALAGLGALEVAFAGCSGGCSDVTEDGAADCPSPMFASAVAALVARAQESDNADDDEDDGTKGKTKSKDASSSALRLLSSGLVRPSAVASFLVAASPAPAGSTATIAAILARGSSSPSSSPSSSSMATVSYLYPIIAALEETDDLSSAPTATAGSSALASSHALPPMLELARALDLSSSPSPAELISRALGTSGGDASSSSLSLRRHALAYSAAASCAREIGKGALAPLLRLANDAPAMLPSAVVAAVAAVTAESAAAPFASYLAELPRTLRTIAEAHSSAIIQAKAPRAVASGNLALLSGAIPAEALSSSMTAKGNLLQAVLMRASISSSSASSSASSAVATLLASGASVSHTTAATLASTLLRPLRDADSMTLLLQDAAASTSRKLVPVALPSPFLSVVESCLLTLVAAQKGRLVSAVDEILRPAFTPQAPSTSSSQVPQQPTQVAAKAVGAAPPAKDWLDEAEEAAGSTTANSAAAITASQASQAALLPPIAQVVSLCLGHVHAAVRTAIAVRAVASASVALVESRRVEVFEPSVLPFLQGAVTAGKEDSSLAVPGITVLSSGGSGDVDVDARLSFAFERLLEVLGSSTSSSATSAPASSLQDSVASKADELLRTAFKAGLQAMMTPAALLLRDVHSMNEAWSSSSAASSSSSGSAEDSEGLFFSMQPSKYVTQLAEHLLALAQALAPDSHLLVRLAAAVASTSQQQHQHHQQHGEAPAEEALDVSLSDDHSLALIKLPFTVGSQQQQKLITLETEISQRARAAVECLPSLVQEEVAPLSSSPASASVTPYSFASLPTPLPFPSLRRRATASADAASTSAGKRALDILESAASASASTSPAAGTAEALVAAREVATAEAGLWLQAAGVLAQSLLLSEYLRIPRVDASPSTSASSASSPAGKGARQMRTDVNYLLPVLQALRVDVDPLLPRYVKLVSLTTKEIGALVKQAEKARSSASSSLLASGQPFDYQAAAQATADAAATAAMEEAGLPDVGGYGASAPSSAALSEDDALVGSLGFGPAFDGAELELRRLVARQRGLAVMVSMP